MLSLNHLCGYDVSVTTVDHRIDLNIDVKYTGDMSPSLFVMAHFIPITFWKPLVQNKILSPPLSKPSWQAWIEMHVFHNASITVCFSWGHMGEYSGYFQKDDWTLRKWFTIPGYLHPQWSAVVTECDPIKRHVFKHRGTYVGLRYESSLVSRSYNVWHTA